VNFLIFFLKNALKILISFKFNLKSSKKYWPIFLDMSHFFLKCHTLCNRLALYPLVNFFHLKLHIFWLSSPISCLNLSISSFVKFSWPVLSCTVLLCPLTCLCAHHYFSTYFTCVILNYCTSNLLLQMLSIYECKCISLYILYYYAIKKLK